MSVFLRVWGIGHDLPYVYHPDEPVYIEISQRIFKTGELNPRFFNYPSLFFYIHALAYAPYYFVGRYLGPFESPGDILAPVAVTMGVVKSPMPTTVLLGRVVTVAFGVGCVVLTFLATRVVTDRDSAGLLAAALTAVSPVHVSNNRWVTPDTLVTFFALASFLASSFVLRKGRTWQYAAAGIGAGLAASSKYNGALIVSALLAAHFLRSGVRGLRSSKLYLALPLSGLAFVATTPFAVLDYPTFIEDLQLEAEHYLTGHPGMEGETVQWYARYLWTSVGPACLFAVGEMVWGGIRRSRETALVTVFLVTYFVFISRFAVRNARTIMPLTPYLFVLAGAFWVRAFDWLKNHMVGRRRPAAHALLIGVLFVSLAWPSVVTARTNQRLSGTDGREMARRWIEDHLAPDTKIAIESYGPFVDAESFSVHGFVRIIEHQPGWYVENDFDYLVLSDLMYGRYYRDCEKYAAEVSEYDVFFSRMNLVREFAGGGATIRIYRVAESVERTLDG
jgi:4-amino-4-deoxy-L-arabinose transferase-like glycosyltransferase